MTPRNPPAIALDTREFSESCAVNALTAVNTRPTLAVESPNANAPAGARSLPISASACSSPISMLVPPATITAAASGACRPTTVAAMSSVRPASSSARVYRVTTSMAMIATNRPEKTPQRHTTRPPSDDQSCSGPSIARKAEFAFAVTPSSARDSAVAYSSSSAVVVE